MEKFKAAGPCDTDEKIQLHAVEKYLFQLLLFQRIPDRVYEGREKWSLTRLGQDGNVWPAIKRNALCKITVSPHIHPYSLATFLYSELPYLTFHNPSTFHTIVVLVQIEENVDNPEKAVQ